jgi:hypothetical protein
MNETKTFPQWTPKGLKAILRRESPPTGKAGDLCIRLAIYPSMKLVWARFNDWFNPEGTSPSWVDFECLYMYAFAVPYVESKSFIASKKVGKRSKALRKIERHARLLSRYMREIGLTPNTLWYVEPNVLEALIYTETLGAWQEATARMPLWLEKRYLQIECDRIGGYKNFPLVNIFEILAFLGNSEALDAKIPHAASVHRSAEGKEAKLALIRGFAEMLQNKYKRNPRLEMKVIASFAQAVLPDIDITTETVKDALRNYSIPTHPAAHYVVSGGVEFITSGNNA